MSPQTEETRKRIKIKWKKRKGNISLDAWLHRFVNISAGSFPIDLWIKMQKRSGGKRDKYF